MPSYIVRYGMMRLLGVFEAVDKPPFARGARVIVRSDRGLEAGQVLCDVSERTVSMLRDARNGQILRAMTADDRNEITRMQEHQQERFDICLRCIGQVSLPMQLVDVEYIFGGERIVVYYLAENRVDFRELVKLLAAEFQTRIEMRQIGVRDEAKLLADYGDCGQPVCCNNHLIEMPPVSMRMAKLQKATLDPTKISGRCGRLKCCLRYEYELYEQLQKEMPPLGSPVVTSKGPGRVVGQEILTNQVLVETADRTRILIPVSDVTQTPPNTASTESPAEPPVEQTREPNA